MNVLLVYIKAILAFKLNFVKFVVLYVMALALLAHILISCGVVLQV